VVGACTRFLATYLYTEQRSPQPPEPNTCST